MVARGLPEAKPLWGGQMEGGREGGRGGWERRDREHRPETNAANRADQYLMVGDLQRANASPEASRRAKVNRGDLVFIPRIDLAPTDTTLPFILRRRQFPHMPSQ